MTRYIDADALMEYCSNQKSKIIDNNDIARFPTVEEHDGCKDCMHELKEGNEEPCKHCKQNYTDKYKRKDTKRKEYICSMGVDEAGLEYIKPEVELVRCRDCKNRFFDDYNNCFMCRKHEYGEIWEADGFCSLGEKK